MTVSGYFGTLNTYTVVKSLKLETNLHTYGPYGAEDGQSFQLSAGGGEIIGFHGRSGQFLDAIGAYVKVQCTIIFLEYVKAGTIIYYDWFYVSVESSFTQRN